MMTEMKPCPFCGSNDLRSGGDDKIIHVWCTECEASGPNQYREEFDWNTRMSFVDTWQPIDTAPIDGSDILAWDGNDQYVLFHSKYGNGWTDGDEKHAPTHWMPLPNPPVNN